MGNLVDLSQHRDDPATLVEFVRELPLAVAMFDREMRYLQASERWCTNYELKWSEIAGRSHYDVFPDLPERWRKAHRSGLAGETVRRAEDVFEYEDGRRMWVRWEVHPWGLGDDGRPEGVLIFTEDITDRKLREIERLEAERKLGMAVITSQEEASRRIAGDLHDDIGQRLAALLMMLSQAGSAPGSAQDFSKRIRSLRVTVADILDDVRRISHEMHPEILEILGLNAALESLCEHFERLQDVRVHLVAVDLPESLDRLTATCFYRVAQEALRNVAKHARAQDVRVELTQSRGSLQLIVADSGAGFDPETVGAGLGRSSMRERMLLIGGTLTVDSAPGQGTTVTAVASLPPPSAATQRPKRPSV